MRRVWPLRVALALVLGLTACGRLGPPVRSHRVEEPAAAAQATDPDAPPGQEEAQEEEVEEPLL